MKNIASISGGKDSVAMCLHLLETGERVDEFVFADTGVEFPECYAAIERFEMLTGRHVTRLKAPFSFEYLVADKPIRPRSDVPRRDGTLRRTIGYGWPNHFRRFCTARLKTSQLRKFQKAQGEYMQLIGIAADEPKRLKPDPLKRYPLAEWGWTERRCLEYCRANGFYVSPCAYDFCTRVSCYVCPLMNLGQIEYLVTRRPELWAEIKRMERRVGEPWKRGTEYYEKRFLNRLKQTEFEFSE